MAGRVLTSLAREGAALRLATAGDLRRMAPRVEGVVLLATAHDAGALLDAFLERPWITGERHPELDLALGRVDDVPVVVRVLPEDEVGFAAQQLWMTARQDHFAALAARADARGLALDPRGLWQGEKRMDTPSEAAMYELLDLPVFPPELREGADLEPPPDDLVEMADVRGIGGIHTSAGEGRHDLAHMAGRVRQEGYRWMVLADETVDAEAVAAVEREAAEDEKPFTVFTRDDLPELVVAVHGSARAEPLPPAWHAQARADGLRPLVSADAHDLNGVDDAICALGQLRRGRWRRGEVLSTLEADEVRR